MSCSRGKQSPAKNYFSSIAVTISSSKRVKHKAGPNSPKIKIASIMVKCTPCVNVPHRALHTINAADRTISQVYAKTANSDGFRKKVHLIDQSEQDQFGSSDEELPFCRRVIRMCGCRTKM